MSGSKWFFGSKSLIRLGTVHPDLAKVMMRALELSPMDFAVTSGRRTQSEQMTLVLSGASKTLNSRHITGHAVDIAIYVKDKISWDWEHYDRIAKVVLAAAKELKIPVVWGGSWESFRDGPHFELDKKFYK